MSPSQPNLSLQKSFIFTIPSPTASAPTVREWIRTWPFENLKDDIQTRQVLSLLCRRVSLTGAQIRELDIDAIEEHLMRAGFCRYEAKEVAVWIAVAVLLDDEKEGIRRNDSSGKVLEMSKLNNVDWDKLVWDLVWVVVPLLSLCWAYRSTNHTEVDIGSSCSVRELVAFTGGVWVGIWMMAYPRLSYRIYRI